MVKINTTPLKWLLSVVIHLVLLQSAFEIKNSGKVMVLSGLKTTKSSDIALSRGADGAPADRVVLFVVEGLSADIFAAVWNNSHLIKKYEENDWMLRLMEGSFSKGRGARLKEILTGIPGVTLTQRVESLCSHTNLLYIGPPSLAQVVKGKSARVVSYNTEWDNTTNYPFPRDLDEWLFERLQLELRQNHIVGGKNIVLVYLPGPHIASQLEGSSSRYASQELLNIWQKAEYYRSYMDRHFADKKTAYILTSDRPLQVYPFVPFVTGGAGFLRSTLDITQKSILRFYDIASLVSTLLGVPIPNHSFGVVPLYCLKNNKLRAMAALGNAQQSHELYLHFHKRLGFVLSSYFSPTDSSIVKSNIDKAQRKMEKGDFLAAVHFAQKSVLLSREGIEHYVRFNSRTIYACVIVSLVGWVFVTSGWVLSKVKITPLYEPELSPSAEPEHSTTKSSIFSWLISSGLLVDFVGVLIFILLFGFMFYYSFPLQILSAGLLSVSILWLVVRNVCKWIHLYNTLSSIQVRYSRGKPVIHVLYFLFFTILIRYSVLTSSTFLLAVVFSCLTDLRRKPKPHLTYWTLSVLPFLVFLHFRHSGFHLPVLIIGCFLWTVSTLASSVGCSFRIIDWAFSAICCASMSFILFESQRGPPLTINDVALRWAPSAVIIYIPLLGSPRLVVRLTQISLCVVLQVLPLSLSVEMVSLFLMCNNIWSWLILERFEELGDFCVCQLTSRDDNNSLVWSDFRQTFYYLGYVITIFLSLGNSYNPDNWGQEWAYYFSTSYDPIIIVLLKTFPVVLLLNVVGNIIRKKNNSRHFDLKLLLSSTVSLLHFFFNSDGPSNIFFQLVFLTSLLTEPISNLLLRPSLWSKIKKSKNESRHVVKPKPEVNETEL